MKTERTHHWSLRWWRVLAHPGPANLSCSVCVAFLHESLIPCSCDHPSPPFVSWLTKAGVPSHHSPTRSSLGGKPVWRSCSLIRLWPRDATGGLTSLTATPRLALCARAGEDNGIWIQSAGNDCSWKGRSQVCYWTEHNSSTVCLGKYKCLEKIRNLKYGRGLMLKGQFDVTSAMNNEKNTEKYYFN